MNTVVKLKIGNIEIEVQGSEDFISKNLIKMATEVANLNGSVPAPTVSPNPPKANGSAQTGSVDTGLSLLAVAKRLNVKSLGELIRASAAYLALVKGSSAFSKEELRETVKNATGYYKNTMGSNYASTIEGLKKNDFLREGTGGKLSLSPAAESEMSAKLA